MADAYAYGAEHDSQDTEDQARQIARCVSKLKGSSRNSQLRVLAGLLEQQPQDVGALGSSKSRDVLLESLCDKAILHSKQKDVRMYAAACFAQLLRIYAPDTPYDDKQLEPVFELLLWSIEQVHEHQAPTYEFAVSVLQTISQTKSYFIVLDWSREELLLDWVRALLQCINAGSSALAGPHALEVLVGIVGEEGGTEAVLELLLSHLVPPRSQENPLACQLAQAVLKACESTVKPALQKYLTTLILSPISSNSDLHQHCYTLIYQLYMTVPQVLLPVIPHLTSELHSDDGTKRQEAATLLGRLLSLPGNRLVNEYKDVLDALLRRYSDTQVNVRLVMLDFTSALVAAAGSEELQQQVLTAAAERLQDYEEKVRLAAVKAVCQASRQLLVGPVSNAAAKGPGSAKAVALLSPVDAILGSLGNQEMTDAAAADLDLATAADLGSPGAAAAAVTVRDLPYVHEALRRVYMRLRDTKVAVRRAAASHFLSIFRAVVAAGDATQLTKCCWLVARVLLCCKSDRELREQLFEATAKDGLLGPKTPPALAAAAWVRLWLASSEVEREALLLMLTTRTRLQVDTLQFLALRRKLSGRQAANANDSHKLSLDQACKQLAAQMPQPDRAVETLGQLMQVRDNHAFAVMQTALAPGASQEAYSKARADALARVGSRSPAAEAVGQLLLWGHPAAWLATPIMGALLELVAQDPEGEDAELVQGAYQLLLNVSKSAPLLAAGLLPELHQMMLSPDSELQQLAVQMLARCAAQMRKCGATLFASCNAATAKLAKQQLLPCLRRMARGQSPSASGSGSQGNEGADDFDSLGFNSQEGLVQVAPKAAKWAVFGLAACQDSTSTKRELQDIADELAVSLDAGAPDTAAKLQALSVVGRLMPDALSRHMEPLLRFVTSDYFDAYIDAAAGGADMQGAGGSGRRRSLGSSMLLSPTSQGTSSLPEGSQDAGAAGLMLKCAALKALAAACVPDSDGQDAPVETLRVVVRLSEFLEGLLEPGEESLPLWMSDASAEMCGQLRLSAALSLLRLARRHDTRISPATYTALALMMQDEVEGVRATFAAKVYRLMRYFLIRPSSHQLSAKYGAMLPLAAADPIMDNKVKAARLLRSWVHERRCAVQAQMSAAARDAQEGGSTLQDLPEMMVPYGLYILAHHPDFPQEADAEDAENYAPFQFMLQFMLQPLLAASGTTPAGHMAPVLLKMCRTLKRTADAAEPAANIQLYSLCDMASTTVEGLASAMQLQLSQLAQYAGGIILPRGLYRALDKADRVGGDLSYLPPGYEFVPDPQPAAALAAPMNAAPVAAPGKGRSRTAAPAGGGGRGSKRKAAAAATEKNARQAADQEGEEDGEAAPQPKRARGAGGRPRSKGRGKAAPADSDDGWHSADDEDAPPSAQKGDQLTRRQQVLRQQQQCATTPAEDAGASEGSAGTAAAAEDHEEEGDSQQQQRGRKQQGQQARRQQGKQAQQSKTQQQFKQQQLTFAAAAAADASSPAPVRRGRQRLQQADDSPVPVMNGHHAGGSSGGEGAEHDGAAEGSSGESPFAALAAKAAAASQEEEKEEEARPASKRARGQQQQRGQQGRRKGAPGAAAAAREEDAAAVDADGDVAMDEDQEQQQAVGRGRGRAATVRGAAAGKKTAKGATAAAARSGGRATRQRGAA